MNRPDVEPLALTPAQVAQALGVHPSTVFRMLKRGELPAIRILNAYRVRKTDLEAWLAKQPVVTGIVDMSEGAA